MIDHYPTSGLYMVLYSHGIVLLRLETHIWKYYILVAPFNTMLQ